MTSAHEEALRAWEHPGGREGWAYARVIVGISVTALGVFLLVTQPALQSSVLGIVTGVSAALTTLGKVKEAVATWFEGRRSTAA